MTLLTQNTLQLLRHFLFIKLVAIVLFLNSTSAFSQDIISEEFFNLKSPSAIDTYFNNHFEISIADTLMLNRRFLRAENLVDEIHKINTKNKEEFQKLITLIDENNLDLNNLNESKIFIRKHNYLTSEISNQYKNEKVVLRISLSVTYNETDNWRGFSGIEYDYYEPNEQSSPSPQFTSRMDTTGYKEYAEKIISIIEREDKQAFFAELANTNSLNNYKLFSERNKKNFKKHNKDIHERAAKTWRIIKAMNSYSFNHSISYQYVYDAEPNDVFKGFQMLFKHKNYYKDSYNAPIFSILILDLDDYFKIYSFEN